jgi:phospholipid/cholesterol/gamma-HCH transport system substrate-binding protein
MNRGLGGVAFRLAVFTIVTIIVTVWLAAVIGNARLFSSPYAINAEFKDATGLLPGDVVKAAGVTIGRVQDIQIEDGLALVTMNLDEGTEIPTSVHAEIRFRNLIGQRMINLVEDEEIATAGTLGEGDVLPLERNLSAFDLTVLFEGLRPLIRSTNPEDINIVSRAVVEALDGREKNVAGVLRNIALLSDTLADSDQEISSLLTNVNAVTSNLASKDQQLQRTLGNIHDFFGDLADTRSELAAAIEELDGASRRLNRILDESGDDIHADLEALSVILDAVDDKRADLRGALRALPEMLIATERANSYGEWSNLHVIHVCRDDFGTCGARGTP